MLYTPFHAKYFAYELTKRNPSGSMQRLASTLVDAQVDLNPHQVEAALFAFRSPLSKGAILADEVGLGKTIEAGILISQKWAERKRKLLIITPANLRKQWNQELSDKFFLTSMILETSSFNEEIKKGNLNPFDQKSKTIVICSYQFARAKEMYMRQVDWDLVIIDEAHRLRNVYKPANKIGKAIKEALANVPKVLLTATPLQNSLLELYGLVSIIDDYTFGDIKSFKAQFVRSNDQVNYDDLKKRLEPICKRTLRRQVKEYINYTERIAITQDFYPSDNEQRLYNLVSDYLQRPNLYALPRSQRQLMTLILRKLLASSSFAITRTLEGLAEKLSDTLRTQAAEPEIEPQLSVEFESLDEMKDEWLDDETEDSDVEKKIYTPDELEEIKVEITNLKEFRDLAASISKNAKGEVLITALTKGFEKLRELGAQEKAIIFTESVRTQEYLRMNLEEKGFKDKIVLFNGSNTDAKSKQIYKNWIDTYQGTDKVSGSKSADMRAALVEYFRNTATIMIATEAAAEGINLQFCSLVVNYDLPWNPQRIEQRIGRCHRYGQKFDVVVVNFLNRTNAADVRVFELLAEKFKLFDGVFGASDEVLGAIESGVDFEKRIAAIYQNCRTEVEIKTAFDELQRELEPGIEEQMKITRIKLFENIDESVLEKLRLRDEESKEYLGKYESWLWQLTKYYLQPYATFDHSQNSFVLDQNPFPTAVIHPGPYRMGKSNGEVNVYRVGHPLAQRIIQQCKDAKLEQAELIFQYSTKKKISILEDYVGKSGWMRVTNLTISSFEAEDHLLFAGFCDDGTSLDPEQCHRIFSLEAEIDSNAKVIAHEELGEQFKELNHAQEVEILEQNALRNSEYFDEEYEKLDKWADDVKSSLEMELKELDKEIKARKTETKKILSLEKKVLEQRHIKEMERKRNEMRQNLYKAQDDVEQRKDHLLTETENHLRQQVGKHEVITFRWRIV